MTGVCRLASETSAFSPRATPRRILQGAGAAIAAALMAVAPPAWAAGPAVVVKHGETVTIDGVRNIVMHADQAKGGILLLTGGDGRLNVTDGAQFTDGADNVLIRNRDAFAARGYNVMLVDLGTDLAAAVGYMSRLKAPVTVIGTSKGTERLAQGLAKGARPDKVVLSSGFQPGIRAGRQRASHPGHAVAAAAGLGYPPPRGSLPLDAPGRGRAVQDLGRFEGRGRVAQRRRGRSGESLPLQRASWLRRPGRGIRGPRHGLCREVGSRAARLLWRNPGRSVHGGAAGPCPY